ncbi:PLDc N-terminal domain-containing protein [Microbacterium sp. CPCC 204701]|uniref:PLDc N-terminal domain-containing protein n=1 Tax=Microbacterium sp. CPCC 204701 TaxID=2493084 RepID=UPI001F0C5344|nr:PLDc N-terminal domain-containing protein [Microbacterium sp. CPCC 204701]
MTKAKTELSPAARTGLGLAGLVQVAFAFLAFWDLAHRDARDLRGSKPLWIPVILVNWIGPASYFLFGIRR